MAVFLILAYGILSLLVVLSYATVRDAKMDRYELLLLAVMALGPIAFLVRRWMGQRRATAGSITTERYIQTPAFQQALHRMMMQRGPQVEIPATKVRPRD